MRTIIKDIVDTKTMIADTEKTMTGPEIKTEVVMMRIVKPGNLDTNRFVFVMFN